MYKVILKIFLFGLNFWMPISCPGKCFSARVWLIRSSSHASFLFEKNKENGGNEGKHIMNECNIEMEEQMKISNRFKMQTI